MPSMFDDDNSQTLACQRCDKHFTRPENLARHMKTHNSVQKHRCTTCGRQFTRSDLRKKHELLHERPSPGRAISKSQQGRQSRNRSTRGEAASIDDRIDASMLDVDVFNVLPQLQAQEPTAPSGPDQLDESFLDGSADTLNQFDPYFDYESFARPWDYNLSPTADTSDLFSSQFFVALHETDLVSESFQTPQNIHINPSSQEFNTEHSDRTSREASPPNESSLEDRLPFAWDPRSRRIAKAKPIVLSADDPIFANFDNTTKISQEKLSCIQEFLRLSRDPLHCEDVFTMPELALVNIFISLFFKKFLPQTPIIHRPTTDIESLPPALLAIIIVIGSCYSRLRHTRRFGIILFDRIRQNLSAVIEKDNSLMRDPWTIYAAALVCYMGLWCGNKRAFELSEVLRAVVITYIRRLPNVHDRHDSEIFRGHTFQTDREAALTPQLKDPGSLEFRWRTWATLESRKRLGWFVYMLDAQFPVLLGMGPMLTAADIRRWECPCDESFWTIATARAWKNRLGSASGPSCPVFGSLTATLQSARAEPLPDVNSWSASLLIIMIIAEVFHFQETLVVLHTFDESSQGQTPDSRTFTITDHRSSHLLAMLESWNESCNQNQSFFNTTSSRIQRCSAITYLLARLYLVFPISEIQDCLGRSGPEYAEEATERLAAWISQFTDQSIRAAEDAAACISITMSDPSESDPYDIIGLFLCHVILWAFAQAASPQQKQIIVDILQKSERVLPTVLEVIKAGFACDGTVGVGLRAPQLIFRHAIQSLAQLGTWGASANLALLLHLHPGSTASSG